MKKILVFLVVLLYLAGSCCAFADDIQILSEDKLPSELNGWLVKTICAEGHVFLVTFILGGSSGAGVHAIQVYEERDGKSVPMRCRGGKRR
ncbi:hypothetical protein [Desulfatibacillum aliphaticivorans]|uniref:Lipoprotein n=1 Tax=Desulfatibacillum aliphaticivorans TaxID=218208 RepID=B8FKN7_DESAL|nr:hypothetical protein [Desulfatibacillum aliphaticivorans]ACL04409.1 hypothetical protein Dalk_2717 [Desulfatibacillum aliphaticivorans]